MAEKRSRPAPPESPTLEKLAQHMDDMTVIQKFLDWLQSEKRIILADKHKWGTCTPTLSDETILVREFFDLDSAEIEKEQRAHLEWIRQGLYNDGED